MSTNEAGVPPAGRDAPGTPQAQLGTVPQSDGLGRARWLAILAGLLAGLVAFGIGEATYELIRAATVQQNLMGSIVNVPDRATSTVADARNAALAFAALGACLGGCLGVAGGLARRSRAGAVTGGLLGVFLGLALGAGTSLALLPWFIKARYDFFEYDLLIAMIMHVVIWGLLGASAGLAFAVGLGESRLGGRSLLAGLVGAVLGAMAFELIGAVAFTGANTNYPISETWPTRLMARLLVTVGTAMAVALLLPGPPSGPAAPQAEKPAPPPEV
jgi:hypothetical protein